MHGRYIAEPRQAARKDMGVRNYIVLLLFVVNNVIVIHTVIIVSIVIITL